jgi:hypothetical protein
MFWSIFKLKNFFFQFYVYLFTIVYLFLFLFKKMGGIGLNTAFREISGHEPGSL